MLTEKLHTDSLAYSLYKVTDPISSLHFAAVPLRFAMTLYTCFYGAPDRITDSFIINIVFSFFLKTSVSTHMLNLDCCIYMRHICCIYSTVVNCLLYIEEKFLREL